MRRRASTQQPKPILRRRRGRRSSAPLAGQRSRAEERRRASGDPQRRFGDGPCRASDDSAAHGSSTPSSDDGIGEIKIPRTGKLLEDIEREAVALTLKITGGNQAAASRLLGISRPTLAKKMPRNGRRPRRATERAGSRGQKPPLDPAALPPAIATLIDEAQRSDKAGQREIARRRYEAALYLLRSGDGGVAAAIVRRVARTYLDEGQFDAASTV